MTRQLPFEALVGPHARPRVAHDTQRLLQGDRGLGLGFGLELGLELGLGLGLGLGLRLGVGLGLGFPPAGPGRGWT
eukprot:scaffold15724_cov48-Phaeocystis_antarctica.AAC.1